MPAILILPQTKSAQCPANFPSNWQFVAPYAQGDEGKRVYENATDALRQWNDRSEVLIAAIESSNAISYEHIPLEPTFSVKVHYRHVGRLKPRQFPLKK